jgi:hypothetical protein
VDAFVFSSIATSSTVATRDGKMKITPTDVMRIAYAHIMLEVDQHTLAAMWAENQGRVNEICKVFEYAMHNHMLIYRQLTESSVLNLLNQVRRQEEGSPHDAA